MPKKGYKQTKEHKSKVFEILHSPETLQKQKESQNRISVKKRKSNSMRLFYKNGGTNPMQGKIGEKNYNWKGGEKESLKRKKQKSIEKQEKLAGRKKSERCEICGIFEKNLKRSLCFDHDHETGKFRGWLCWKCNAILGLTKDDYKLLIALSEYILKNYEK